MDLHLLPLVRREGQDQAELPGLYVAPPPRRPARGRQSDRLILYLSMEGNAPLGGDALEQLLRHLAESYYKTSGSVTAAMRAAIESLNQYLLDRNLRSASSGYQTLGLLTILTQRDERLYLAQCGPVHAFLLAADSLRRIFDPQPARRGLGLGRTAPIYYSQATLSANDLLLICHRPPAAWNETMLAGLGGQGLESLRRRLIPLAGDDVAAFLILARPGPGKTILMQPRPIPDYEKEIATPVAEALPELRVEAPTEVAAEGLAEPAFQPIEVVEEAPSAPEKPLPPIFTEEAFAPPPRPTPAPAAPTPARTARRRARSVPFAPAMATLGNASQRFSAALGRLLQRMLPGEALPGPTMALIAVIIPLVVVAIAMLIYFQRGRGGEGDAFYAQAVQAAGAAQAQTDPLAREQAWLAVLDKLDTAESYTVTPQTQALRQQALQAIDALNLALRLEYQPAIAEGLPSQTRLTRMLATPTDLYMLDGATGSVYRAIFAGQGYDVDKTFQCGPGFQGSQAIGPLVDVQLYAKPDGSGTALLGIDGAGGMLECSPGAPPAYTVLAPPPTGWTSPIAFVLNGSDAFVLDPGTRQIWIYRNNNFTQSPDLFFDQDIPALESAIDMAADQQDLYLLHQDGHITQCTISGFGVAVTQCTDPALYVDARPGREGLMLIPETAFTEVRSTQPPDPSIYLLEPDTASLYHFSLRLAYQRQLRPQPNVAVSGLVGSRSASAFTISPDLRTAFLAFDDEVVYASMP